MSHQGYSRNNKLKHRKKISELFENKQSVRSPLFRVLFSFGANAEDIQIGVAVPKRNVRKAVDRNRIKRLIRESVRKKLFIEWNANLPKSYAELMFIYQGRPKTTFTKINEEINECFNRLEKTSESYEEN